MNWEDEGIILSVRPHGETSAIVDALTEEHGRHAGLVRGGQRPRQSGSLQPGSRARLTWNARLSEHLGTYRVEPRRNVWVSIGEDGDALSALASMLSLLGTFLPDREPCPGLYHASVTALRAFSGPQEWPGSYANWELCLLRELGYGLDLERCAATGQATGLAFVSPRTGRAVSRSAGVPFRDKLLKMPEFLKDGRPAKLEDLLAVMDLTGHFLEQGIVRATSRSIPAARVRLEERLRGRMKAGRDFTPQSAERRVATPVSDVNFRPSDH